MAAMAAQGFKANPPQAFMSSYAPRIRQYANSLLTPVVPPPTVIPGARTTKRGTTAINYAEDGFDDDDFDDSEGGRRFTGLRSRPLRLEAKDDQGGQAKELGKEVYSPVDVQGIWRDWMGKSKRALTERQVQIQNALPLVLIPIRIDLNVQPFRPEPPLPTPSNFRDYGIDETLPAYKLQELTPEFRLKDAFLWNLHEALITPDQFAKQFVDELDFAFDKKQALAMQIAEQIRQQLEAYAGVAMHPLFSPSNNETTNGAGAGDGNPVKTAAQTPLPLSRDQSSTPAPTNGVAVPSFPNGLSRSGTQTPRDGAVDPQPALSVATPLATAGKVTATASAVPVDDIHNPDDTFRCVINLSINLLNHLYTDKFEWSLLHPPGLAEHFAKQTCADLGLAGEWVPAMAHAIYEAVLKLRKEACENFGIVGGGGVGGEVDNDAAEGAEAGWRYEPEHLADEWEPKVELLSKDEIEKREGDRERQLRRLRRETARFSSTANIGPPELRNELPEGEQPMGRGERSKKKRRFRSLSPLGRETPDVGAGYGGGTGTLADWERQSWRCTHCKVWGSAAWMVREGPAGPRSLCQNCGFIYERDKRLPPWSANLYELERPFQNLR